MTTSLTLLIISILAALFLLSNKSREQYKGKSFVSIGTRNSDYAIRRFVAVCKEYIELLHVDNLQKNIHKVAVHLEKYTLSVFHRMANHFEVFGDIVTGRDIPKNRGSVSFFLKNIEDEKNRNIKS